MKRALCCALAVLLALAGCDSPFDVHPYDVNIDGPHDLNRQQVALIERAFAGADTLRVAFISDTHGWYSDASDEIEALNRRTDVDFVVHCGDLTDTGTTKEYLWARSLLGRLKMPYVALIGNHDFLGTGDQAYDYLFGDRDFSFVAGGVKFLCLNTNATEYDYLAAVPNFDFMESEIALRQDEFRSTLVVMHAPPFSDQFNNNVAKAFRRYIDLFPHPLCCIYGHNHTNDASDLYADGLMFYGIDCAQHRNYRLFTITPDSYAEELVYF